MITIVGFDTSLAAFGYAVAEMDEEGRLMFTELGCFTTKPGNCSLKGEDTSQRVMDLHAQLRTLRSRISHPDSPLSAVVVESLALPFGRTSMKTVSQLGRARTLADVFAAAAGARLMEESAVAVKKAVTGDPRATKEEMISTWLKNQHVVEYGRWAPFPAINVGPFALLKGLTPVLREHAVDAAGSILAARGRILREVGGGTF